MSQAEAQIDRVTRSDLREVVGTKTLAEVVTTEREQVMKAITEKSAASLAEFGIEVRDVRINRTELPAGTEENVYARMRSQREQLARKYRAEGDQEGRRIRAEADRDARVTVADAQRDAEMLRGEGEAEAARIYAEAHAHGARVLRLRAPPRRVQEDDRRQDHAGGAAEQRLLRAAPELPSAKTRRPETPQRGMRQICEGAEGRGRHATIPRALPPPT